MSKRLFDVNAVGNVFFFVRPYDHFMLNSLEQVEYDEYLYRVLRAEGYERVVFIEAASTRYLVYTFDKLSEISFRNPDKFKGIDWHDPKARRTACEEEPKGGGRLNGLGGTRLKGKSGTDNPSVGEWGKREVLFIAKEQRQLRSEFTSQHVQMALMTENIKTALVIDSAVVMEGGADLSDVIKEFLRKANNNIVVFTMETRDNFRRLTRNVFFTNIFPDFLNQEHEQIITKLKQTQQIILADSGIGTDEIASLLIRKKMFEDEKHEYEKLPYSKIYALADAIRLHMTQKKRIFRFIPYKKYADYINRLNSMLMNDKNVAAELIGFADKLKSSEVNYILNRDVYVERVTGKRLKYIGGTSELEEVMDDFDALYGAEMQAVKERIFINVGLLAAKRKRAEDAIRDGKTGKETEMPYMNMCFFGGPGSGKTTIANLTARLMHVKGILPSDKVVTAQASDLIGQHLGETDRKIRELAEEADGGVLFLDELSAFDRGYEGGSVAKDAMDAIVASINSHRDSLCIILGGYEEDVKKVLSANSGNDRRFPYKISLSDYSQETLMIILDNVLQRQERKLADGVRGKLQQVICADKALKGKEFGNAGYIENMVDALEAQYIARQGSDETYILEDVIKAFPDKRGILVRQEDDEELIRKEFEELTGAEMQKVKEQIFDAVKYFDYKKKQVEKALMGGETGSAIEMPYMNMCFFGGPGTGKTTVAHLTARLLHAKGLLPTDHVESVQAGSLIESRVGGTEKRISELAEKANGGVLLLDEFSAFDKPYTGGNVANDAMDAIVGAINDYGSNLCVIVCGYESKVKKILAFNEGNDRRFPYKITFEDYSVETLMRILELRLERDGMRLAEGVQDKLWEIIQFDKNTKKEQFGNAGYIKNLAEGLERAYVSRDGTDHIYVMEDLKKLYGGELPSVRKTPEKIPRYSPPLRKDLENLKPPYDYENMEKNREALAQMTDSAVLYIKTDQGDGTGFLISPDGYALTCYHVIEGASKIIARLRIKGRQGNPDSLHRCTVVRAEKDIDMALLRLEGDNFPYLPLAPSGRKICKQEEIILSGYPFGKAAMSDLTTFRGSIASGEGQPENSGSPEKGEVIRYFIDGQAKCGNSGSPVIALKDGRVIGILIGSVANESGEFMEEINYLRPVQYFWDYFLKEGC